MIERKERRPRITVGELIAQLRQLDPSLPVLVDGYEEGMETPEPPEVGWFAPSRHRPSWYEGDFESASESEAGAFRAVLLSRKTE
jgi:hypothetical protein